jgi:hypothetical protein
VSSYLDEIETQLESLTDHGAHRRLRLRALPGRAGGDGRGPRRLADAIACAAVILVTVAVAAVVLNGHGAKRGGAPAAGTAHDRQSGRHPRGVSAKSKPKTAPTNPTAPANPAALTNPGGPVPAGFVPRSFTAISELTWWLLGTAPCNSAPCTSIVRTTDGGRTFVGIPAPRITLATASRQVGVSQLRFADANDGFAYGPALFVTHDAGATWHQVDVGGSVNDLAIADGEAYAVVTPSGDPLDKSRLLRSPISRDQWGVLSAAGHVAGGLWVHGSDVLIQSDDNGKLLASHDSGASFNSYPVPSPGLPCQFQEMAPSVLWEHCATGMMSDVWRSLDGGASFRLAGCAGCGPGADGQLPPQPNSAAFAAASSTTAVVGYQQLYQTSDSGAQWTPVGPKGLNWVYLGFTDATHGVGLATSGSGTDERLYYTTDAGVSYHPVPIP